MKVWLNKIKYIFFLAILLMPVLGMANNGYPKLANYYLRWQLQSNEAAELAKWDLLILDMQNQYTSLPILREIKKINPNIKLLAYFTIEEVQDQHVHTANSNPWGIFYNHINNNDLWLRQTNQDKISIWHGTNMIDITKDDYHVWIADFVKDNLLSKNIWDGIFLDNSFDSIDWVASDLSIDNQEWRQAMDSILKNIREVLSEDKLLVVNSSSYYKDYINGRLYESWPEVYGGNWISNFNDIKSLKNDLSYSNIIIINSNTSNKGNSNDWQKMRYGMTSALLTDSYYSFDFGDQDHAQLWWYDEYNQYLGNSLGESINLNDNSNNYGVWKRDFEQGLVLLNSTLENKQVNLDGEYEKIKGTQDKATNNGMIVSSVSVPAQDGLVIIKRIKSFDNAVYNNGSFARVYNSDGQQTRNGFFVYDKNSNGNFRLIKTDLNSDKKLEKVIAGNNWIEIYDDNDKLVKKFYPYTQNYNQGINFTVGDLNGDGWQEIVTGTERGGGSQIRIFSSDGRLINPGFFAYDKKFRGGVSVAVADLNGNGQMEIIAGAGYGGGPHVRIFDQNGKLLSPGFMAFDSEFRGGVTVAAGDVNNDGKVEIIATPTKGGKAEVSIFDANGKLLKNWLVYNKTYNNGLQLAITDLSGNGKNDIIVTIKDVFTLR